MEPATAAVDTFSSRLSGSKLIMSPQSVAEKKAAKGRTKVMIGSMSDQVTAMESTPDSGVDIKKAAVAPLLAPRLRSSDATGITLHEQRGSGTPISEARITERVPLRDKIREMVDSGMNALIRPAMAKPNNT